MPENTFRLLYATGLVAGSVIRALYTRRHKREEIADHRRSRLEISLMAITSLGFIVIPVSYLLSPWLDFADYGLPTWARLGVGWLGAALFAAALWLLWRSHVDLGENWSPQLEIRQEHSLVTRGMYRYVRHPMYAAHWIWAVAQAMLLQNWIAGWAFLVLFLPLYLVRVPREEQMMLDRFGEEYRAYMARTGRMVPPFWR